MRMRMQPCDYDAAVGRPAADRSVVPPPSEKERAHTVPQVRDRDRDDCGAAAGTEMETVVGPVCILRLV